MEILKNILLVPEIVFAVYLGFASIYFFVFAVASHFYREKKYIGKNKKYKVVLLIPSYKEDSVIVNTAISAINHKTVNADVDTFVIADSLKSETISKIIKTGAKVIPVLFEKSTKAKSINEALNVINNKYDYVIVLDADNIMKENFIYEMLIRLEQGFRIIQGHRTAKNSNTNFAVLDGLSESVNNAIFRTGHRAMGLSSSIIGSGFACGYQLFKHLMKQIDAVGGFDKQLELILIERKIVIGYAKDAIVYDEKVQQSEVFLNQRRRWLSAQFVYFSKSIGNGLMHLLKNGNFEYIEKILQFALPPRILTIGLTFIIAVINLGWSFFIDIPINILSFVWLGFFFISIIAVIISIPISKYNLNLFKSLLSIPKGFLLTLLALFKIKGANQKFIHTTHGIDN
jgi:cellulose synthase/poly-beta-1,6-N-acetylglucosamine synthase-like glycosyltransferase